MADKADELWTRSAVTVHGKVEDFTQLIEDLLSTTREKDADTHNPDGARSKPSRRLPRPQAARLKRAAFRRQT